MNTASEASKNVGNTIDAGSGDAPTKILAFVGLGHMGYSMARNLASAGFPLRLYNRTRAKAEALAEEFGTEQISVCDSPSDAARGAHVVCACLASEAACEEVLLSDSTGTTSVLSSVGPGTLVLDHSTVSPDLTRRCHEAFASAGAQFLDAPISGGPEGARDATLAIMLGGSEESADEADEVLTAMGTTVARMGPPGAGTAAKLVNQLLVGVHAIAACE